MIIRPKKSYLFLAILVIQHLGATTCLWLVGINIFYQLIITLLILFHFFYAMNRYIFLKHPSSIIRLDYVQNNHWQCYFHNGQQVNLNLQSSTVITQYMFLHFKNVNENNKSYQVILFPDSENSKILKRCRAVIKILFI